MTIGRKKATCISIGCLILFLLVSNTSVAQSIYAGGSSDGFSHSNYSQPDNILLNIYAGGNEDGFSLGSFAQADNVLFDIYKGGIDDGFSFGSFAQADNVLFNIYKGGNDDGFSFSSFAQADNVLFDIYKGGNEDGFSFSSFAQADNVLYDIYKGGIADGFSFSSLGSIGSEVPLPIELISFKATVESGVVKLIWVTASELNNDFFQVERSQDGKEFLLVVRVEGAGTTNQRNTYQATDESPIPGTSYYMLTQTDFDGTKSYSKVVMVRVESELGEVLKFYPNPVHNGDILHFEYLSEKDEIIQLSLTDPAGKSTDSKGIPVKTGWNNLSFAPELINKGVYLIRVQTSKGEATLRLIVF